MLPELTDIPQRLVGLPGLLGCKPLSAYAGLKNTLQESNISQLKKRKIIFKYALLGGYVSSLEGTAIDMAKRQRNYPQGCTIPWLSCNR